ncbi:MAG: SDR family oxidoreductase [Myxococcota bacterium]
MTARTTTATTPIVGANLDFDPREDVRGTKNGPGAQTQDWPGETDAMHPAPDHGEESYVGGGRLRGKKAIVTGGDSGIGRAVAIAFAREGADVAIVYFDEHDDAADTVRWIEQAGRQGLAIAADLVARDACIGAVAKAVAALGHVDVLVNNAGFQRERDFDDILEEDLLRTVRTNLMAPIWVTQAALEHMPAGASIIITGSVTALDGSPRLVDYSMTKGGLHSLVRSLALALGERGIRVNAVAPGPVWTPLIPATLDKAHVTHFGRDTMWQRPAQPIEIATSYVFLASSDSRFYTGEVLAPTGKGTTR